MCASLWHGAAIFMGPQRLVTPRRKISLFLLAQCAARLVCGYQCARPLVRTDTRDQQWYCGDHDLVLPKRRPMLLELPGEIRNEIYKYAFPPFLGLHPPWKLKGSSIWLLTVNKQVYEEVTSLMYGTKPLPLVYEEKKFFINPFLYEWDSKVHYVGTGTCEPIFPKFLNGNAFKHVKNIEIEVDPEGWDADNPILQKFVNKLCTEYTTHPKHITIEFRAETLRNKKKEVQFFGFLQALREIPGFKDTRFELMDSRHLEEDDVQQLLQRACAMRDCLLVGRKRKLDQFQE